jgi:acetoin:2,6-dichlorophenolindophenol oxidoreductase subunit alpha
MTYTPRAEPIASVLDHPGMSAMREACERLASRTDDLVGSSGATVADYELMVTIRRAEEKLHDLKVEGVIAPNIHQCIGQEAISAGAVATLEPGDYLTSTYRGHGHALAKGASLRGIFAEALNREGGLSHGRAGTMHMIDKSCNLIFESAIVGGAAPLAVGAALTVRTTGSGQVAMTIFGDGATAQGTVSEAMNLAGAWRLPVVFLLENNGYSELTPTSLTTSLEVLAWRGIGQGLPAVRVDGNEVAAVRAATRAAREWASTGNGPVLIEAMTYRSSGHYSTEQADYRSEGELAAWRDADPLPRTRATLEGRVGAAALAQAEADAESAVADAEGFARSSPPADPTTLFRHVYAGEVL